jgi:fatty acid desaturase
MTLNSVDAAGFAREVDALRAALESELSSADFVHLRKLERWGRACSALGYATAWLGPNLFSAAALSLGNTARWTIIAHHLSHKSMDKVSGAPARYTSRVFAKGKRRLLDWLDWMAPEAWHHEHDVLHHFHTGEISDPDLVEENVALIREAKLPLALKYAVVAFYAATWKFTYYAPNTFQILKRAQARRSKVEEEARGDEPYLAVLDPRTSIGREYWATCVLPYGLARFVVIPGAFIALGPWAVFSVWGNSLLAELLTNLHTFIIIAPNHAGDDIYRFDAPGRGKADLYLRQVAGSVNYRTGGDVNDFLHGFLNYQIEHHLFPTMPPKKYQEMQPKVRALCEKYGVPYVQQPVWSRVKKLVDIMVGKTSMLRAEATQAAAAERSTIASALPRPSSSLSTS